MELANGIPLKFHKYFGAWVRLEPRCRSNDFARGLEARTADPLWMLARQWQTGEFWGEDAGSPLVVHFKHSTQPLDRVRLGQSGQLEDLADAPLEVLVEREKLPLDWRARVQIGQQFEHFIRAEPETDASTLIEVYRAAYSLDVPLLEEWQQIDRATRRFIKFMAGRVIDGQKLLQAIQPIDEGALELLGGITKAQLDNITRKLMDWYGRLYSQPAAGLPAAWRNQQLEYRFEVNPFDNDQPIHRLVAELGKIEDQLEGNELSEDERTALKTRAQEIKDTLTGLRDERTRLKGELDKIEGQLDENELDEAERIDLQDQAQEIRNELARYHELRTRLIAPNYRNGALDWYTFNIIDGVEEHEESWNAPEETTTHPTRISVAGASPRWWAFEDANIDFGRLDVAKPDLAKLLLMEFVLIYGDDWFSVPLPVRMGSLVRIDEMWVKNVFGENPDDPLLRWELFTLSPHANLSGGDNDVTNDEVADVLLVPPVAGFREESPPLEEIRFLRDEGANKVWGVEHIVQNGLGRPVDGFDAQRERNEIARVEAELEWIKLQLVATDLTDARREELVAQERETCERLRALREGSRPGAGPVPRYRLATTVPENWIPFVPAKASHIAELPPSSMRLWRAQMLPSEAAEEPQPIPAITRLLDLSDGPLLWLEEASVPRSGLRAQLTAQRIRWTDGKTYVWLGRKVLTGRGEGSSGLRFDIIRGRQT